MRANSEAVRRSHHFRCASWAHRSAYAHDTPGHTGAPGCRWGRHTRIPGIGGRVLNETKHVHVIGIGGSAMAPLAGMLRERGFRVSGSDSGVYPPASTLLESLGISFFNAFDAAHLHPAPDLVVIGNIIARGNPELEEVLDRKIPYRSMPEILEEFFLPERHSIVGSGTHGKTTTTAMLAWIFHTAGKRPNFLVGGVAENFGKNYGLGGGEEFILEGDEYETAFWDRGPKFFHYHPDDLIITSLEYDHADIYPDFEAYQLAFRRLVNLVPRRGRVVIWGDAHDAGPALRLAAEKAFCPVETYGFNDGSDWVASGFAIDGEIMRFRVAHRGKSFGEFALAATGRHKVFQEALPKALALADRVILGGVFRAQQLGGENRLDPETVAESVRTLGKDARVFHSSDAIAEHLGAEAKPGDLLLIMSNGSFDGLCEKVLKKLGTIVQLAGEAKTR